MKLLTKTTLYYLLFSFPLLLLSGWLLYHNIEVSLKEEIDEELDNSKEIWIQHVGKMPADKDITQLSSPFIQIEQSPGYSSKEIYSDTLIYQPEQNAKVPFRNLVVFIKRNNNNYKLSFQRSVIEEEDVISNLIILMCVVFGGLLLLFLLINLYINKKLWKPFNISLDKITSLNMQELEGVHFDAVSIKEFNALNNSLNTMTTKMYSDFLSMKTFTQNASHEIQTPLAIIQSKLELLLQDSKLTEEQVKAINSAGEATQRLSKLNQALLLITKIGNNQFVGKESIRLDEIVEKYRLLFAELIDQKGISCNVIIDQSFTIVIHPLLADMLISNLFINAIKYNKQHGEIRIDINDQSLKLTNTSNLGEINNQQLFQRFAKHDTATGNGLGLAIVKEIADSNGLKIMYTFTNGLHTFSIST